MDVYFAPMEMNVLYSYAYRKGTQSQGIVAVSPTIGGTISIVQSSATTASMTLPISGLYSYLQLKRVGSDSTINTSNINPSAFIANGSSYVYTDTGLSNPVTYIYTMTPYVLGTAGVTTVPFSLSTISPPTAFSGLTSSLFTLTTGNVTGFTLSWTGGSGVGVNYSYYVNTVQVYPSASAGSVIFTGLPTPSSSTAYSWYVDICANNLAGTTHGIVTVNAPPTPITSPVASSPTTSGFTLSWTGGLGNGVPNPYTISNFTFSPAAPSATVSGYSLTGTNSTIAVGGLSGNTAYTVTVTASNGSGTNATNTANPISILNPTSVSATGTTKTTTGLGTTIYVFTTSTTSVGTTTGTLTVSGGNSLVMNVLAIAGGGSGGSGDAAGGGGAGGLIVTSYTITGNNTLTISVGSGGLRTTNLATSPNGINTTVSFSSSPGGYGNLTCIGGGGGGRTAGGNGGSGGGTYAGTAGTALGTNNNRGFNAGTAGLPGSGGGGAGGVGGNGGVGSTGGAGGVGYQSNITGTNLYWGGGGGGCAWGTAGGNGGLGGGGGGGQGNGSTTSSTGGGSAFNPGTGSIVTGGDAGANTGGGGGGAGDGKTGGAGGSGIAIVSFSTASGAVFN